MKLSINALYEGASYEGLRSWASWVYNCDMYRMSCVHMMQAPLSGS